VFVGYEDGASNPKGEASNPTNRYRGTSVISPSLTILSYQL
jgi:hypothetical protein